MLLLSKHEFGAGDFFVVERVYNIHRSSRQTQILEAQSNTPDQELWKIGNGKNADYL